MASKKRMRVVEDGLYRVDVAINSLITEIGRVAYSKADRVIILSSIKISIDDLQYLIGLIEPRVSRGEGCNHV